MEFLEMEKRRYDAVVYRVIDGDTLEIEVEGVRQVIRLIDIDCPENGQYGHKEAKEYLEKLVGGREVSVFYKTEDKYGRPVCRVFSVEGDVSI